MNQFLVGINELLAEPQCEGLHVLLVEVHYPLESGDKLVTFNLTHQIEVDIQHILKGRLEEALRELIILQKLIDGGCRIETDRKVPVLKAMENTVHRILDVIQISDGQVLELAVEPNCSHAKVWLRASQLRQDMIAHQGLNHAH